MAGQYLVLVIGTFGESGGTFHEIAVWTRLHGTQFRIRCIELRMDLQATGDVVTHENGRFHALDPLNHMYTEDGLRVAEEH